MQAPLTVDTLVEARWIIPIEPPGVTLDHHAVVIERGVIVDLLPIELARTRFQARNTVRLPHHVLLPGLINLHTHAAMSLLRGYADDVSLMDWLNRRIWPAEAKHVSSGVCQGRHVAAGAEMLRGGSPASTTCIFTPKPPPKRRLRLACALRWHRGNRIPDSLRRRRR